MKKNLICLWAISILTLTWCEQQDSIIGQREADNGNYCYSFNEWTGTYQYENNNIAFTYTIEKNNDTEQKINFHFKGDSESNTLNYSISGNILTIIDNFGEEVVFQKKE